MTVREMLRMSTLAGAGVLAGEGGLDRVVQRLNVMEVPDILPWVKPDEFLLTTAYPLRDAPGALPNLVGELHRRGLSGVGIKLGRYIDAIPPESLRRADELDFPIVQLPDGIGFDDILNQVLTEILNRQAATLARSEQTHHALLQIVLSGGGLPEIARDLAALLAGATAIVDADGRVRADARLAPARAALLRAGLLEADGTFALTAAPTGSAVALPGGTERLLVVPISAGTRLHGHIIAVEQERPFDAEDLLALENAATVAALVITKELAVAAVESKFQSDFLHDLLSGRITDVGDALARGAALGWDLDRPLVVLVVQPDEPEASCSPGGRGALLERLVSGVRAATRSRDERAAVVGLSAEVVVLTGAPGGDRPDAGRELAGAIGAEARGLLRTCLSVGISRVVDDPLAVAQGYEQAGKAVRVGRQISGPGAVTHFDDLGAYRLLSLIPEPRELTDFAAETLGELAEARPDTLELRRTLQVLLETNLNIAESARRLHFHYNTLRYRVEKLEGLLGPFTEDPALRLNLQLALQIVQMRNLHA